MTDQVIHGAVKSLNMPVEFYFSAIYEQHTVEDRRSLRSHLRGIANGIQDLWLVMGNFNTILRPDDRVNGNVVTEAEARDFNDFIVDTGMGELKTVDRSFTWTNSHIFSRIDRAIGNAEWMIHMDHIEVQILDPHFSDQSPLCVDFAETVNNRPKPIKFLNHLADHHDFLAEVETGWMKPVMGNSMKTLWLKLKNIKNEMKTLNNNEFSSVGSRIKDTRRALAELQEQMRDYKHDAALFDTERNLKKELEKWSKVEESIYRQKSRIQWLQLGDANTAFFYASIKNRTARNQIKKLNYAGDWIQTEAMVKEKILGFYKKKYLGLLPDKCLRSSQTYAKEAMY
ncbi:PREDICTED: uncharacterized protein LOC109215446 [Nicotiana attenuata]|uniref:uncharacterized protein LOC109215446 n=1 Tax=Nicotiana attenuata TaxID=49451 RepID=UPI00090574C1|nr:PREDICTED: uncharacterized protein LOC109215446 [Nicotiana attenuata]